MSDTVPTTAVLGSIAADLLLPVGGLPSPGETVLAWSNLLALGSERANQAVAAARLAASVRPSGPVRDDPLRQLLREQLARPGSVLRGFPIIDASTAGVACIAIDTADNTSSSSGQVATGRPLAPKRPQPSPQRHCQSSSSRSRASLPPPP